MRLIFASEERMARELLAAVQREATGWEKIANELQAQNADLLATVLSLKAAGAAVPTTPTKRATDRVLEVISDVAGSNAPLRGMLGRYARQQRAANVKDDEIIQTLMHWPDADEEVEA